MKIDRSKALVLVSVLASAACTSENDEPAADVTSAGGSSSGGNGGTATSTVTTGTGGLAGSSSEGEGGLGGTSAEGLAGMGGQTASAGGAAGMAGDGGVADCDDSQGTSVDCTSIVPDSSCSDLAPFHQGECESAKLKLKPAVAQAVGDCILAQTPTELCDALNTYDCVEQALAGACADPSASTHCEAIITACPSVTEADCVQTLSGMTSSFRDEAVTCMQDTIFSCDFRFCAAEGL